VNDGGRFVDVEAGVGGSVSATGGAWADFDSDGDVDLLVSTVGATALYENQRDGAFADVGSASLPASALAAGLTGGVATADYDADGDIDAFISHLEAVDLLLRNDVSASGRWLQVELAGRPGQTVIGSRVRVRSADGVQLREYAVSTQIGTASGHELHFGLGDNEQVELDIHWASGQQQTLSRIAANQRLRLREPVPGQDLRIDAVTEPSHAPGWRPMVFEVVVSNVGGPGRRRRSHSPRGGSRSRAVRKAAGGSHPRPRGVRAAAIPGVDTRDGRRAPFRVCPGRR
jgi:hypothetical protein